jgi:hypothetical protein
MVKYDDEQMNEARKQHLPTIAGQSKRRQEISRVVKLVLLNNGVEPMP